MPVLTVIAGQNGSGKSTLVQAHRLQTIDPDRLARGYGQGFSNAANARAAREALHLQAQALAGRQSFGIETTLAGKQPLRRMEEAREAEYEVRLAFVIPESENTRLRIDVRVQEGGHNIADADLERRRPRVLEHLPEAMRRADMTALYLANIQDRNFVLVGAAYRDEVKLSAQVPDHIRHLIEQQFQVEAVESVSQDHPITQHFQRQVQQSGE
ncbi:zeta toxin family protein (plasmid) [Deinococcus sp. D7000]|nr:zeta toxin family protein [Deinococcus sp. D7000]